MTMQAGRALLKPWEKKCAIWHYAVYSGKKVTDLKIDPEPFLPLFFLVFIVVELIQLPGPVRHVCLQLAGVFEQLHGKELLPEIAPVKLYVEDGLVEIL